MSTALLEHVSTFSVRSDAQAIKVLQSGESVTIKTDSSTCETTYKSLKKSRPRLYKRLKRLGLISEPSTFSGILMREKPMSSRSTQPLESLARQLWDIRMLSRRPILAFKADGISDQMDLKLEKDGWTSVEFAAENGIDYIVYEHK